jgi:hypothetical protein
VNPFALPCCYALLASGISGEHFIIKEHMMRRVKFLVLFISSLGIGLLITWVDSRPGWDDTGITAGAILLAGAVFGLLMPERAWLWALLVGGGIPLVGILLHQNYTSLLALVFAFIGAYLGVAARKVVGVLLGSDAQKP